MRCTSASVAWRSGAVLDAMLTGSRWVVGSMWDDTGRCREFVAVHLAPSPTVHVAVAGWRPCAALVACLRLLAAVAVSTDPATFAWVLGCVLRGCLAMSAP